MSNEEQKTGPEILSADEQKVREMCLALKKIDAPKDFDFKLKARIANSNPRAFRPRFGFAFRYALPALALIAVFGVLAYSGIFSAAKDGQISAKTEVTPQAPASPQNIVASAPVASETKEKPNEDLAVLPANQAVPKAPESGITDKMPESLKFLEKKHQPKDDFRGSDLNSLKKAPLLQPKFEAPKNIPQNPQNNEKVNPMPVKDVLSINGIDASFENGKWTVKAVTANGIAESSGIKENDVIEAIDNQPLSAETVFNKTANGKSLTVTRNGSKLEIKLRNKQ
jgi:hypothetical protein